MRWLLNLPGVLTSSLLWVVLANRLHAHPGHGNEIVPADSVWHSLLQPEHGAALWLLTLISILSLKLLLGRPGTNFTPRRIR